MSSPRFSLVHVALAAALLTGCNSVLGFQEGKPYPPDASIDVSVDGSVDGSDGDSTVPSEGGCPADPTGCRPTNACHIGKLACTSEAGSKCADTRAVPSQDTPSG